MAITPDDRRSGAVLRLHGKLSSKKHSTLYKLLRE
jgi:hypothetical protein